MRCRMTIRIAGLSAVPIPYIPVVRCLWLWGWILKHDQNPIVKIRSAPLKYKKFSGNYSFGITFISIYCIISKLKKKYSDGVGDWLIFSCAQIDEEVRMTIKFGIMTVINPGKNWQQKVQRKRFSIELCHFLFFQSSTWSIVWIPITFFFTATKILPKISTKKKRHSAVRPSPVSLFCVRVCVCACRAATRGQNFHKNDEKKKKIIKVLHLKHSEFKSIDEIGSLISLTGYNSFINFLIGI